MKDGLEGWMDGKDGKSDSGNSNGLKQAVSIVVRKALAKTDELSENDEKDTGPEGWMGKWDMPEEVRRARTTGGTSHHHKSQEVKDFPDGWRGSIGKDEHFGDGWKMEMVPNMMTNSMKDDDLVAKGMNDMIIEWNVLNYERFDDRNAHDEMEKMMNVEEENQDVSEDSLKQEDDFLGDIVDINFKEKFAWSLRRWGSLKSIQKS